MLSEAVEGGGPRIKVCERQTELETSRPLLNSGVNPHYSEFTWHLSVSYALVLKLLWVFGDLQVKLTSTTPRKVSTSFTQASGTLLNTQRAHA